MKTNTSKQPKLTVIELKVAKLDKHTAQIAGSALYFNKV